MYLHELANELGLEPRDVVERASWAGFGVLSPDSTLTDDQVKVLRGGAAPRALFGGSAPAGNGAPPPPASDRSRGSAADESVSSALYGAPLGFAPPGSAPPPPPPSAPAPPSSFMDEPAWEPLSRDVTVGGGTSSASSPGSFSGIDFSNTTDFSDLGRRSTPTYDAPPPEIDLTRFRAPVEPLPVRPADKSRSRSLLIGVVGLLVLIMLAQVAGRRMNLIGPGAERHCVLTVKPMEDGEGTLEEVVCVDGNGREVSREVQTPDAGVVGIEFGTNAAGETTRIIDLDEFCRGASNFEDFRSGLAEQMADAKTMGPVGSWFDEHDGYAEGGLGTMLATFGNAGPNPQLEALDQYVTDINEAVRTTSLPAAQMMVAATEQAHEEELRALRAITLAQC